MLSTVAGVMIGMLTWFSSLKLRRWGFKRIILEVWLCPYEGWAPPLLEICLAPRLLVRPGGTREVTDQRDGMVACWIKMMESRCPPPLSSEALRQTEGHACILPQAPRWWHWRMKFCMGVLQDDKDTGPLKE